MPINLLQVSLWFNCSPSGWWHFAVGLADIGYCMTVVYCVPPVACHTCAKASHLLSIMPRCCMLLWASRICWLKMKIQSPSRLCSLDLGYAKCCWKSRNNVLLLWGGAKCLWKGKDHMWMRQNFLGTWPCWGKGHTSHPSNDVASLTTSHSKNISVSCLHGGAGWASPWRRTGQRHAGDAHLKGTP